MIIVSQFTQDEVIAKPRQEHSNDSTSEETSSVLSPATLQLLGDLLTTNSVQAMEKLPPTSRVSMTADWLEDTSHSDMDDPNYAMYTGMYLLR